VPLYIAGARIASMYPCSIPFHGQAVNITVESYCDRLDFGLIACRRAVPDVAQLADRLAGALAELQRAVAASCPVVLPAPVVVDLDCRAERAAIRGPERVAHSAAIGPLVVDPGNGRRRTVELPT
jgi:hypothetical protein